jgi:hypothetical protein
MIWLWESFAERCPSISGAIFLCIESIVRIIDKSNSFLDCAARILSQGCSMPHPTSSGIAFVSLWVLINNSERAKTSLRDFMSPLLAELDQSTKDIHWDDYDLNFKGILYSDQRIVNKAKLCIKSLLDI